MLDEHAPVRIVVGTEVFGRGTPCVRFEGNATTLNLAVQGNLSLLMRRPTTFLTTLALALLVAAPPALAGSAQHVSFNCVPVEVLPDGSLIYNARGADGMWDAYRGTTDCRGQRLLPPGLGHRGASDVSADGRHVLLETATGPSKQQQVAEPGKGYRNDIQRLDRTTGRVQTLVTGREGTIWARFNAAATKLTWAEMERGSDHQHHLGVWSVHVAAVDAAGRISGEREWQHPTEEGFFETYGWMPGTNRLVFASDTGSRNPSAYWTGSQLWSLPDTLPAGDRRTRLSPPFPTPTWCAPHDPGGSWCEERETLENPYHEFAHFKDGWLYTSIVRDAAFGGMDLWRTRFDGSRRQRVSWFGGRPVDDPYLGRVGYEPVEGYGLPRYAVVGSLAFLPDGSILAAVTPEPGAAYIDAYRIRP